MDRPVESRRFRCSRQAQRCDTQPVACPEKIATAASVILISTLSAREPASRVGISWWIFYSARTPVTMAQLQPPHPSWLVASRSTAVLNQFAISARLLPLFFLPGLAPLGRAIEQLSLSRPRPLFLPPSSHPICCSPLPILFSLPASVCVVSLAFSIWHLHHRPHSARPFRRAFNWPVPISSRLPVRSS